MAEFPEIPNFAAVTDRLTAAEHKPVLEWLSKLAEWCKTAVEADAQASSRISDLEQAISEARDAEEVLTRLYEDLEDVGRGIRTLEEVLRV